MVTQGSGHVVTITTSLVEHPASERPSALTSLTKGGLAAVDARAGRRVRGARIRVNAIAPGVIQTPEHDARLVRGPGRLHPLGRLGEVDDIVEAILYLERATFVTGETLHVDGGQVAGTDPAICHPRGTMVIHLIDGTYELFRHFYGRRSGGRRDEQPLGAAAGVLHTVLQMLETGATHVGVATDHVIESFRNDLWPGYKTGAGVDPALRAQFEPLEEALAAMGVARLADGRARGRRCARRGRADRVARTRTSSRSASGRPTRISRSACVGDRVVQVDRRADSVRNADGVREKFGVEPERIPDLLALVGDAADGYPGIPGIGKVTAARLVNRHGSIEEFPDDVLGDRRDAGAAVQGSRDAALVRRALRRRRCPSLARPDSRVRLVGGTPR